jgi:hypothetical protein
MSTHSLLHTEAVTSEAPGTLPPGKHARCVPVMRVINRDLRGHADIAASPPSWAGAGHKISARSLPNWLHTVVPQGAPPRVCCDEGRTPGPAITAE